MTLIEATKKDYPKEMLSILALLEKMKKTSIFSHSVCYVMLPERICMYCPNPFDVIVEYEQTHLLKIILESNLYPNFDFIFHTFIRFGRNEYIQEILPMIKSRYIQGSTLLYRIITRGNVDRFEILKELEAENPLFWERHVPRLGTPLAHAIMRSTLDMVKAVAKLTDVNKKQRIYLSKRMVKGTYLQVAVKSGRFDVFKFIYKQVTDKFPRDSRGRTLMDVAPNPIILNQLENFYDL